MHLLRRSCRMEGRNGPGGPLANKDKNNAYNRAYKPSTNIEEDSSSKDDTKEKEEEEDSSNNNSTGNSTSNSKDKAGYEPSNSSLYRKDKLSYR
ncbi:hypothetical protein P8C59_005263 [Phyllachora maydis]|uniref:Uncharacterized protein n=1 Tax=Phyllachora maydis TaxID=1825666 RepID=A0AAD9I557_9PEZI|nr:hypothetical protein P8C59_005263 [Phyllachora maydis]